jgi:hypothetical protein
MTQYLAELYTPRPAWLALDHQRRVAFFEDIGTGMAQLLALGVEAIAFGQTDATKIHAASQQFFAIWRFSDEAALNALLDGINASGWHDYFDTVNAAGAGVDFTGHVAQLVAAQH